MANTYTNPTLVKSKPHGSAEKQVGDADVLSRTDVVNRVAKGILHGGLKRLLNAMGNGLTFDFTSVTDPGTTGLPTGAAGAAINSVVWLTNNTGGATVVGDVCAVHPTVASAVGVGDTVSSLFPFAVALDAVANGVVGRFVVTGYAIAKATGTINVGEYVRRSATSKSVESTGVLSSDATPVPPAALGIACTAASGGLVTIYKFGRTEPTAPTRTIRTRFSIAQINAGATLLAAVSGMKYRMVDALAIAIGGNVGATTTVDLLGTQATSSVKLLAAAQASLTQSAVVRAGGTGGTVLADGASFAQCDANTAITIGKTGSDLTTASHVDVIFSYVLEL